MSVYNTKETVKRFFLSLFDKIGFAIANKVGVGAVVGITTAAIVIVGCTAAYLIGSYDNELPPDPNELMANEADIPTEDDFGFVAEGVSDIQLEIPYLEMGYDSLDAYWKDLTAKRSEADGMTDAVLAKYGNIFSDTELEQLYAAENKMENTALLTDYDEALKAFNDIVDANKPKPVTKPATGNSGSSNSGNHTNNEGYNNGSTPYNFKFHGVLHETNWRWTYYSSRVLYHYMTPQWWCDSDGIWRDSNGYAIVACDSKPQGTVIQTELFGSCIVMDNGVGRSDTLDLYVNW